MTNIINTSDPDNTPNNAFTMRAPCPVCQHTTGTISTRAGQDCVFCATCNRHCYNAPRTETGRPTRNLRTRPDIKPSQRARILLRENATCAICHRGDTPLDIAHIISVKDGRALGLSDAQLYDDENLLSLCAPCNSGISDGTLPLRICVAIFKARHPAPGVAPGEADTA